MKKDTFKTKVIFGIVTKGEYQVGDTIALFPELGEGLDLYMSYMHLGQHSEAHIDYFKNDCSLAEEGEYEDLVEELESLGYNLEVINYRLDANFSNSESDTTVITELLEFLGYHIYEVFVEIENYNEPYLYIESDLERDFIVRLNSYPGLNNLEVVQMFIDFYKDNY